MTPPPSTPAPTAVSTLLIVDDHARTRKALQDWLQMMFPAVQCFEVGDAEQAIKVCRVMQPDLILMDVRLPGMNGIEATRRIKKDAAKTHVVVITSHEDPAYQKDSLEAGASAFVHKREMTTALIPIMKKLLPPTPPTKKDQP
jgi:DNA-binding NarL/FixJ family response regulator